MVEAGILISFLQPSYGLRNSAPCHWKYSPRTSNNTYHGASNAKSQAPLQIRICIFWRKSCAIDKPGNCFLDDSYQNITQPIVLILLGKRDLSAACLLNDEVTGRHSEEKTCIVWVTESHGNIRTLSSSFRALPKLFVLSVGFRGDTVG